MYNATWCGHGIAGLKVTSLIAHEIAQRAFQHIHYFFIGGMAVWRRYIGAGWHAHFEAPHPAAIASFIQVPYFDFSNSDDILRYWRNRFIHGKLPYVKKLYASVKILYFYVKN